MPSTPASRRSLPPVRRRLSRPLPADAVSPPPPTFPPIEDRRAAPQSSYGSLRRASRARSSRSCSIRCRALLCTCGAGPGSAERSSPKNVRMASSRISSSTISLTARPTVGSVDKAPPGTGRSGYGRTQPLRAQSIHRSTRPGNDPSREIFRWLISLISIDNAPRRARHRRLCLRRRGATADLVRPVDGRATQGPVSAARRQARSPLVCTAVIPAAGQSRTSLGRSMTTSR